MKVIPIVILLDGVVSCLRTYREAELREMVSTLSASNYTWSYERLPMVKIPKLQSLHGTPLGDWVESFMLRIVSVTAFVGMPN